MINPFSEPADPGVGTYNVGVVPTRWSFEFTNGDHHLREHGLRVESVHLNWGDCWVYWFSRMSFCDKNWDDPVDWQAQYTIVALPHSFMRYGVAKGIKSSGGPHSFESGMTDPALKGFDAATVVLAGWQFGFWEKDHHIRKMGVRIKDVVYDSEQGKLSWNFEHTFGDKNGDDDIYYRYYFLVIAFNNGEAISHTIKEQSRTGSSGYTITNPAGSREKEAVLPQGFFYEINEDGDLHVLCHDFNTVVIPSPQGNGVYISPMVFFPDRILVDFGTGRIGYSPNLELDFVVLFFDEGGVGKHPSDEWMQSNVYQTEWGGVAWRSYVYALDPPEFPLCSY